MKNVPPNFSNFFVQFFGTCSIEQYYLVDSGEKLEKESWSFVENDIDGVKTLNYSFVSKEELKEIDLKPLKIKELIISEEFSGISHIISDNRNIKK